MCPLRAASRRRHNLSRSIDLDNLRRKPSGPTTSIGSVSHSKFRYVPAIALGLAVGITGSLPAFLSAAAVLTVIAYWLLPILSGSNQVKVEELINEAVLWFGGWNVVITAFGIATFFSLVMFGAPAHALLANAKAAAEKSIGVQLGTGAVDFFFGGLLVIFFFVIAGALLVGGIQVARSENPGTFFLTAFVFALILGALEFFDKIMFTGASAGPAT